MDFSKQVKVTTESTYTIKADQIEEILLDYLKITGKVSVNIDYDCSESVLKSVEILVKKTENK